MANTELQFEMAMRDQVIHNQREALRNLWNMLLGLGLEQKQIMDLAARQGIVIEECTTPYANSVVTKQSPFFSHYRLSPLVAYPGPNAQPYASTCFLQHHQGFSSMAYLRGQHDTSAVCRQEHLSSYYLLSPNYSQAGFSGMENPWAGGRPRACFHTPESLPQEACSFYSAMRAHLCPCSKEQLTPTSCEDFSQQPKVLPHSCMDADENSCFFGFLIYYFSQFLKGT